MYKSENMTVHKRSLGTRAKTSSARGESPYNQNDKNPKDVSAQKRFKLQRKAQHLLPKERISECMRKLTPASNYVIGWHNPKNEGAGLTNLITCDSYSCPVCAAKRAEQDRHEISVALAQAKKLGYFPIMITYTMSHHAWDKLKYLQQGLNTVYKQCFSGRWYNDLRQEWGVVGLIKAWEVTHGTNGWHPHIHAIWLLETELTPSQANALQNFISSRYRGVMEKNRFFASESYGVDVRTAESDIADYIAKFGREPSEKKWGVDQEIARSSSKKSAVDGLTPFQLLEAACGHKAELERISVIHHTATDSEALTCAENLYKEYFLAFKGVPRLYWSPNLAKLLDMETALAEVEENTPDIHEDDVPIVAITAGEGWRKIIGGWNEPDLRGELLEVIRTGDKIKVKKWLDDREIRHIIFEDVVF